MMTREQALQSVVFKPGAFVVDVGGGHRPFEQASVIFEKHPFEEAHRVAPVTHAAPILIVDGAKMPVPDTGCDGVFCSHVIEHMRDPQAFIRELKRCAEWVYLEFPSRTRELMFAWPFHEWLVVAAGNHLVFYRNDIPQLFGDFFHRGYDAVFDAWNMQRHDDLNDWTFCRSADLTSEIASESAFEYAIRLSRNGKERVPEAPIERVPYTWNQIARMIADTALPQSLRDRLVGMVRRRRQGSARPVTEALVRRLMCLRCRRQELRLQAEAIQCMCGMRYGKRNGLFDFDV
jgi:SAM-dependent methyltransferase